MIVIFAAFSAISAQTIAFTNVNVIPMDKERVLANQTVLVKNGIIAEIGSKVKIPKDAAQIDGKGKYLIPGLMDMHTHLLSDGEDFPDSIAEDEVKVMIANGVTTIRLMIGTPEQLILREKSAKQEIIAPTIYSASPHLTGREQGNNFVVNTPEEAREAVRKSKQAGYDFIKITTFIKAEAYEAAVDEAAKQNIRVVGHADSRFVGVERALKAKQQIEHLDGYMEMLLRDDAPMKGSVSDLYVYDIKNWDSLDYIDENKIPIIAKRTVEANPFVNPTQHFMKNTFALPRSEESIRAQPEFKFYPAKVQEQWLNFYKRNRFINTVSYEKRAKWLAIRNKLIKAIYDAGGKIMAGSDSPEFLFLYGFSQHRELKALADAGLSNYAALEASTKNPSMFFGTLDKVGTIEKGKRADLILLDANPLENITATEKRAGVMLKGKWYPQAELNKWLDEAAIRISHSHIEKPATSSLEGYWEGEIKREGKIWRTNLDIKKDGENLKAFADFVDIDGYGREFSVKQTGEIFRLERPQPSGIPLIFEGKIEGDSFKGNWNGLNLTAEFSLKRAVRPAQNFKEEEVSFKNGDVTLSGTLFLPNSSNKVPLVIFTHGSGAETRVPNRSWAMKYARKGIAALVYDKRGTGKSTGEWRTASMDDLANDALAGLNFLKNRPEIDAAKIGISGHSQGGWVAPLTATKSKDVAFVIASAASGVSPDKQSIYHRANVMREQGFSENEIKIATELREKLYATGKMLLENDGKAETERKKVSLELAKYSKEPWFERGAELPPNLDNDKPSRGALELLFFQPVPMWEKVKVPVLLIWGDKDTIVPVAEGRKSIENALQTAGNKDVTTKVFPNVNHSIVIVNEGKTWDFQRVDLNYFNAAIEWTAERFIKK